MGDLQSIAFSSSCSLSIGDLHNLGVFKADMSRYDMERRRSPAACDDYSSLVYEDADFSSGYLQDVLFHFASKRTRLHRADTSSIKNSWTSNLIQNIDNTLHNTISDVKTPEEAANSESYDSSSSCHKESADNQWTPEKDSRLYCMDPTFSSGGLEEKRKKRVVTKVVYPFALVKSGGFQGDATLKDINERILMPPSRPVRHPVGDFACRPLVSPDGPGLSGKAVVAFTRIHTQGRGTITIIRTRG